MTICNARCRPFGEVTLPEFVYDKKASYLLPAAESIFAIGLFVGVMTQGTDVKEWNFDDPHFRNIVYWGFGDVGLSTLMRLPYTDAQTTALKVALLVYVLLPLPVVTILCASSGHYYEKDLFMETLLSTIAGLALVGRVGTTYIMSSFSIDRRHPERRPLPIRNQTLQNLDYDVD